MTCADARHRILVADISAVRGKSDRVLRAHLDACPACSADASSVVGETRRLGAALAARARQPEIGRVRRRRGAFVLVPIGVAAATTVMVMSHWTAPAASTASTRLVSKLPAAITTSVSNGDTDSVAPARGAARHVVRRVAAASRRAERASSPQAPAISVPTTASNEFIDRPMPEVGVTVGDNQRAAIIATSNPKITVVWLSRGQQP